MARENGRHDQPLEPILVSYRTGRQLIDVGATKWHALINEGAIKVVRVGRRPMAVFASLKALAHEQEAA